ASRSFTHFVKRSSALIWWSAGLSVRRELFTDTILIFGMHVLTVEGIYSDLLNDTCVNRNLECLLIRLMGNDRICNGKKLFAPLPLPHDLWEPTNVAEAIACWGLGYLVITNANRDNLAVNDHFAKTIWKLKELKRNMLIEALFLIVTETMAVWGKLVSWVWMILLIVLRRLKSFKVRSFDVIMMTKDYVAAGTLIKTSIMFSCGKNLMKLGNKILCISACANMQVAVQKFWKQNIDQALYIEKKRAHAAPLD
ncbi:hypothetical protein CUMW_192080, partial [Citrus unshiu]